MNIFNSHVNSYRRMIENKLQGALYTDNDNFLYDTLKNNIFGIDLNQHAIDVAIFSLYLAMLDYKNPKTLKQFRLPDLKQKNLLVCDFFDEAALAPLRGIPFDFIIGNPPWGDKDGKHMEYCREHGYMEYMQKNDTCRAFILRSKDFATQNTTCCFVLHSKMLYMQGGPSKKFRKYLLANLRIKRIIELSSVRELVFKYADAPAVVISYSFSGVPQQKNCFEYISMKKNEFFRLFNIIAVEKTDLKSVQQKLLIKNDWAWKILVYGLTGDFETICKLKATTATLEESLGNQDPPIISGTGVKYNNGQQSAHHLLGRQILDSKTAINHFVLHETKSTLFEKTKIDRPRNPALFKAPYCLLKHGPDMYDYTMKAVYSETDFVFHQAIYAMKGTSNQKAILLNAAGLLNSQIYAYFNLMLGSSLGIEREQQQPDEVLTFPFVFSGDIAEQVEKIQNIKKPKGGLFVAEEDAAGEIEILNQMILDAFDLSGNEYVDYALRIQIPRLTGKKDVDAKREANLNDYEKYGEYFHDYLSEYNDPQNLHKVLSSKPQ